MVVTYELVWLKQLIEELGVTQIKYMQLIFDNQAAIHIASNPVFHKRTKHIEIECHFIREKVLSGDIVITYVASNNQLADLLTKSLRASRVNYIYVKLGMLNIYAPT